MSAGKIKINKHLDLTRLPEHIAIIMDGNGRWATHRGLPRNMGHKAGCENLKRIIQHIYDLGIKYATFFTFSTENWKRPQEEIDGIFNIVRDYLDEDGEQFLEKGAKVIVSGDYTKLPKDLVDSIERIVNKTQNCDKFTLNLAINYGGRDEILRGVNKAIKEGKELSSPKEFSDLLYSANLPDPDFIIRTSGEMRVSNFMLWQMAYSEFYFTKTYWPSFSEKDLQKALIDFQRRKRRYGNI